MSKITTIVFILFGLYVANSVYVIYNLFHVPACHGNSRKCLRPHGVVDNKLEVSFKFTFSRFIYVAFAFNTQGLWVKLVKLLLASRLLLGEILFLGVIEILTVIVDFQVSIYTSLYQDQAIERKCHLLWKSDNFSLSNSFSM